MTNQRLTEQVRRKFTDLEILAFKDHLASKVREHLEQKARRKEAVDGFNAVLKASTKRSCSSPISSRRAMNGSRRSNRSSSTTLSRA